MFGIRRESNSAGEVGTIFCFCWSGGVGGGGGGRHIKKNK